ncbi:MAG: HK97 gp10 family phage protein [Flavobacteriaceae bacterium]
MPSKDKNQHLDRQINIFVKKLQTVKKVFTEEEYKEILASGAAIARDAIKQEAPIGKQLSHIIKDDGGSTKKVNAGNLLRSIQVFSFRGSKAVFAGAVTARKAKVKKVKGHKLTRRLRAFYWKFVYYGAYGNAPNRFIDRAKNASSRAVLNKVKAETLKKLPRRLKKIFD